MGEYFRNQEMKKQQLKEQEEIIKEIGRFMQAHPNQPVPQI